MTTQEKLDMLIAAIREARACIDDAGPHEDPCFYVVQVLDDALDAVEEKSR